MYDVFHILSWRVRIAEKSGERRVGLAPISLCIVVYQQSHSKEKKTNNYKDDALIRHNN